MSNTTGPLVSLGLPLVTITSIGIIIGTFFSILCIIRYLKEPTTRTHFSYIVSKINKLSN